MKTGIELITIERQEQIEKHGFSLNNDEYYKDKQLVQAAKFCLSQANSKINLFTKEKYTFWPKDWNIHFMNKILNKSTTEQLIVAGAFLKAENDRRKDNFWNETIELIAAEIDKLNNIQ
jgi:hypothetical protein